MSFESQFGYVLHNVETGHDTQAETEADALIASRDIPEGHDWSLWRVRKDGTGEPQMIAVGCGPIHPG